MSVPEPIANPGPAVVWLVGGLDNGPGETPWLPAPVEDDQSGSALWKAGVPVLYPVLRGGAGSDASRDLLVGEVDDVLAAGRMFRDMPHVDATQLYLVGHSTGGTLALLVAAADEEGIFKEVIAFGPVDDVFYYGPPFDSLDACERELRSPEWFLSGIKVPTRIIEGEDGNLFLGLEGKRGKAPIRFIEIPGADHFTHLHASTEALAKELLR